MPKIPLQIDRLDTIDEILKSLPIVNYSTQKRNLAYLIQLKQLLQQIHKHYDINRGLEILYRYNILKCNADIIETMLFCALKDTKISIPKGKGKAAKLIQVAKKHGLISKAAARQTEKIIDFRNDFHPDLQTQLHTKIDKDIFDIADETVTKVTQNLWHYFTGEGTSQSVTPIVCQNHDFYLHNNPGEQCPDCGEFLM